MCVKTGCWKPVSEAEARKRFVKSTLIQYSLPSWPKKTLWNYQNRPDTKPTILSAIDPSAIRVGMYITVLNHKRQDDRSFRGDALEVINVALPFLVINHYIYGSISIDSRDWDLAQLPQDYVDAMKKG